jgi:tRNA A37 threonylcarbamoyladenosine modification protein TsaB
VAGVLVLVLDTATPAVTAARRRTVADRRRWRCVAERVTVDARAHGELLAPSIRP